VSEVHNNEEESTDNEESESFVHDFIKSTESPEAGKQTTSTTSREDYGGVKQPLHAVNYDRQELLYTIRDLLGGGSDTTITTILWFLIVMANHPEAQSRMQEEVDDVVGQDRPPTLADEKSMPYSQAVMLETMRRYTILPLSAFHSTTCDTTVGDIFIPAGVMVCSFMLCCNFVSAFCVVYFVT
jgi:cytochrome P450